MKILDLPAPAYESRIVPLFSFTDTCMEGVCEVISKYQLMYSQLRLSRISGDLTNHFDLDKIRVTDLYIKGNEG